MSFVILFKDGIMSAYVIARYHIDRNSNGVFFLLVRINENTLTRQLGCSMKLSPQLWQRETEINELMRHLSEERSRSDVEGLREAIKACQKAGLPNRCINEAQQSLNELEKLLGELHSAILSRELSTLQGIISECQSKGMPSKYLHEALRCQEEILLLMDKLESARKRLDLQNLDKAIQDCGRSRSCGNFQSEYVRIVC